jgi:iron(III) transport system ATP-binding protein
MISVSIKGVRKRFGDSEALKGIDVEIQPGELFFLLGPSGCGKTTLLRSIAGFYIPEAGSIHFGPDDVTKVPPHMRNTGMMFQSYALWPHMTVLENVAFGLEERKLPKAEVEQRAREALASVKMDTYAERRPNQLSGGQQQRVALARALVIRPRCLLLDEPLSNLDARLRLEMRAEIRRVCKEFKLTTIYVTHDQKEALSIADRMAIMEFGHVLQIGTPSEVYRLPKTRTVAHFIGETNFIEGTLKAIDNGMPVVETAVGIFKGRFPNGESASPGSRVTLSIRPECFTIVDEAPKGNFVTGNIGDAVYLGEVAQYDLMAKGSAGKVPLKIYELNPRHLAAAGGGEVHAWVATEDVVVLTH